MTEADDSAAPPFVVAIDGPAASGKGTIARRLAARFGLAHLDTGLLYRAVGAKVIAGGEDPADAAAATAAAEALIQADLHHPELREPHISRAASLVAAAPGVRAALLSYQQWFMANPLGGARGSVLDGRDIGTVICPDATVKLFVTASAEERARRRTAELRARGGEIAYETVLADAHLLDTTNLDIDAAIARAAEIVQRHAPI